MSLTIGHGSALKIVDNPSATVTVAGVTSIEFGSSKADALDSTNMGTAGKTRTFIGGLVDSGDVTVKGNWVPGDVTQAALEDAMDSDLHEFEVVYPSAVATESFSGLVTSFDKSITDDKAATFTAKIKVSGVKTIA